MYQLKKSDFIVCMKNIKREREYEKEMRQVMTKYHCCTDFFYSGTTDNLIALLDNLMGFGVNGIVKYFVYKLDFGANWDKYKNSFEDKSIRLRNMEDLWNLHLKNKEQTVLLSLSKDK